MFERENSLHFPSKLDMENYIHNELWKDFCFYMKQTFQVEPQFEFSKCSWEFGWNIKFKKSSKSLCTIYPRENYFIIMIVITTKEKQIFEEKMFDFCHEIQQIYKETKEGNGQRWLMIELEDKDKKYEDIKAILELKCHGK